MFDVIWDRIWKEVMEWVNSEDAPQDKIPMQPPAIHVTDAATARLLFRRYSGNRYAMEKACDEETMYAYQKFSDSETRKVWAAELCRELLEAIAAGDTPQYEALATVGGLMEYYLYDAMPELYTKAWFAMLDTEPVRVELILGYLELYTKRFSAEQAARILPLLDRTEAYLKAHVPEKLAQSRYTCHEGHFREICAEIRRIVREHTAMESRFSFVKTPSGALDIIRDSLMEAYNDTDAVRENMENLNFAYGVQGNIAGERLFLTGSSDAAGTPSLKSWDILEYVAVWLDERKAVQFRCSRTDDGGFAIEKQYLTQQPLTETYQTALLEAVCTYRNVKARRAFLDTWNSWASDMADQQEAYLAQFPKIMRDVYARIPDCTITETLTELVDYAEAAIGEYGRNCIDFAPPATEAQIAEWEQTHGIHLPEEYRQFLQFANGVSLPSAVELFGLPQLDAFHEGLVNEGYGDYHMVGSFIGDGTSICLCDKDGLFYEWQDGEMSEMGDFTEVVDYLCEF